MQLTFPEFEEYLLRYAVVFCSRRLQLTTSLAHRLGGDLRSPPVIPEPREVSGLESVLSAIDADKCLLMWPTIYLFDGLTAGV